MFTKDFVFFSSSMHVYFEEYSRCQSPTHIHSYACEWESMLGSTCFLWTLVYISILNFEDTCTFELPYSPMCKQWHKYLINNNTQKELLFCHECTLIEEANLKYSTIRKVWYFHQTLHQELSHSTTRWSSLWIGSYSFVGITTFFPLLS